MDTCTLYNKEEMLKNLVSVNSNKHYIEKFYPLLTTHSDTEKYDAGLQLVFMLAVSGYLNEFTGVEKNMLYSMLMMDAREFLHAMTDNSDIANKAADMLGV